jgi:hypothetical protein
VNLIGSLKAVIYIIGSLIAPNFHNIIIIHGQEDQNTQKHSQVNTHLPHLQTQDIHQQPQLLHQNARGTPSPSFLQVVHLRSTSIHRSIQGEDKREGPISRGSQAEN